MVALMFTEQILDKAEIEADSLEGSAKCEATELIAGARQELALLGAEFAGLEANWQAQVTYARVLVDSLMRDAESTYASPGYLVQLRRVHDSLTSWRP